jgi:hypothetical protein
MPLTARQPTLYQSGIGGVGPDKEPGIDESCEGEVR